MIKIIFVTLLFTNSLHNQQLQKTESQKFLENIKQIIQKTQNAKLNFNSKFKTERTVRKLKAKKQIMGKLSNPLYRFKQQHAIIAIKGNPKMSNNEYQMSNIELKNNNLQPDNVKILTTIIKDYFKTNHKDNPFVPLSIDTILKKLKNQWNGLSQDRVNDITNAPALNEELLSTLLDIRYWYQELAKRAMSLWFIIEEVFINDPKGSEYFTSTVCPGLNKKKFFESLDCNGFDYLLPYNYLKRGAYTDTSGAFAPYCYEFYSNYFKISTLAIFNNIWKSEKVSYNSNICRDFLIIFSLGNNITNFERRLRGCVNNLIDKNGSLKNCDIATLNRLIKNMHIQSRRWFRSFELILTKKLSLFIWKQNFPTVKNNENDIQTIINVLLYKQVFDNKLDILEKLYNAIKYDKEQQGVLTLNNCDLNFDKEKDNLIQVVAVNLSNKNIEEKKELIDKLKNSNSFSYVFDKLLSNAPDILAKIIQTGVFKSFIEQIDKLKENSVKKKDICGFLLFGKIFGSDLLCLSSCNKIIDEREKKKCKEDCEYNSREKNMDIANFLATNNMDWIIFITTPDLITYTGYTTFNDMPETLKNMPLLVYYIYKNLILYKMKKCSNYKISINVNDDMLKGFKCIFEDKNLDIKCYFKDIPEMLSVIDYLGESLELLQIREKLNKLKGKKIIDILEEYVKKNVFKYNENLLKCYSNFREKYVNESSLLYFCGNRGAVQYLNQYCLPLKKCDEVNLREITPKCKEMEKIKERYEENECEQFSESTYCQTLLQELNEAKKKCEESMANYRPQICYNYDHDTKEFILSKNNSCVDGSNCGFLFTTLSFSWNNGCLCNKDNPPPKIRRDTFCEYMKEVIENCCKGIEKLTGIDADKKVSNFVESFNNEKLYIPFPGVDEVIDDLRLRIGDHFLSILDQKVKNLPKIYSQYLENKLCE